MQKDQSLGIEQTSSVGPAPVESDTPRLLVDLIGRTPYRLGLQRDFWHGNARLLHLYGHHVVLLAFRLVKAQLRMIAASALTLNGAFVSPTE